MSDFSRMLQNVDALMERADQAMRLALVSAAETVEAHLKATTAYNNQTGATRASSIVIVDGAEGGKVAQAIGAVSELNPGFEASESLATEPNTITVVGTAYTEYTLGLEQDYGGKNAFLGDVIEGDAGYLADEAFAALREVFGAGSESR